VKEVGKTRIIIVSELLFITAD